MADENQENVEKEEKALEQGAKSKKKGDGANYLTSVVLVLNVAVMGAIAYLQYMSHINKSKESSVRDIVRAEMKLAEIEDDAKKEGLAKVDNADGIIFHLKGFTANLAQGDGPRRFLRMNAVLKFSKTSKEEEFKAREPQIRDRIISIINSKRPEDLLKVEGKAYLKEEIKEAINAFLVDGHVTSVFYVGFQIN